MPSASLHLITAEDRLPKSDRLFRAAISSYCSLTRPSGRDAAQLDDLALPLLPLVSEESKRYAAAALSESLPAPPTLLRRLADYPVAVSAPLLVRSRALADIDLIGLIGRNGVAHARAIGRRPALNPNIAALVRALGVAPETEAPTIVAATEVPVEQPATLRPAAAQLVDEPAPVESPRVEATRESLRAIMLPSTETASAAHLRQHSRFDWAGAHAAFPRLVATGLTGVAALFQTAFADAFGLSFQRACEVIDDRDSLPIALKAAGLSTAEAFFVAALAFPPRFGGTAAIRAFIEEYRRIDMEQARMRVTSWRGGATNALAAEGAPAPANVDRPPHETVAVLKAS